MLVAHLADVHLGFRQYNLDEREEDLYSLFQEAVEKIESERADAVVVAGDLFDNPRPPNKALRIAYENFKRLRDKGIEVFVVMGDHDLPRRRGEPPHVLLERLGAIRVLGSNGPQVVEYKGVAFAGVRNFQSRNKNALLSALRYLDSALSKVNTKRKVLILHQAVDTVLPFDYEVKAADLPKGCSYYAMGHVHQRFEAKVGDGVLAYPGPIDIMRRDEIPDYEKHGRGFYLVDISEDEPSLSFVKLENVRPQLIVKIRYENLREELRKLALQAASMKLKPIVHVKIIGEKIDRVAVYRLYNTILSKHVLAWRPEFIEEGKQVVEVEEGKAPLSLRELFREALKDERKAEFAYELMELLAQGDLAAARKLVEEAWKEGFWR